VKGSLWGGVTGAECSIEGQVTIPFQRFLAADWSRPRFREGHQSVIVGIQGFGMQRRFMDSDYKELDVDIVM